MNNFNLILSKIFKQQKKISYKLLNQDVLKSIKYPTLKIMIIDNNFDFSIINNLANIFNLKIDAFKVESEEVLKEYVISNINFKGEINKNIIFYQVKPSEIKKYSNYIKPNYILINQNDEIIALDENQETFENATLIYNKNFYSFKGISFSLSDQSADYFVNNIDFIKEIITINNQFNLNISKKDNNHLENIMMLFALFCNLYNVQEAINGFNNLNKKKFSYKNKTIFIDFEEMNYNDAIKFISRYTDYKVLVIGWHNNQEDVSWLYNIEMERLINKNIQKIYCIGINAYDIATRIKYADFNEKNIIVSPNIDLVLKEIKNYNLNLYILSDKYYINTIKEGKNK